jgi:cation diffusion facilitator CzcD-associated flavoprotein CzcO
VSAAERAAGAAPQHDALIVGAGVCGIYMLHALRQLGLDAQVLEAGDGPGGTWYWNRYPGARFDSESYSYGYTFSKAIQQAWDWSEHFAAQPETLRYLEFVTDTLGLRPHMRFGARVRAARFDEGRCLWAVALEDGEVLTARFLLTAVGMLSAATEPAIEGVGSFRGPAFHTYRWPEDGVALAGQRVAVIGTGATGVQVISAIADEVGALTVFQRRPNWCAPLNNSPITPAEQARIKASYDAIKARCLKTPGGFLHGPDRREMASVPRAERLAFWEKLYGEPGFGIWLGNFRDVLTDPEANAEFSAFIADKIRARVHDPAIAEKLIPRDHGFGSRRVPMETGYYEAYNRPNVRLVDLNETPIERITETGIETTAELLEFDVIVYATGFDAITGAYDRIHIEGVDGRTLAQKWAEGPITCMGTAVAGFPNLITLAGPQSASVSSNFPPAIESAVEWAAQLLAHLTAHGITRIEAREDAERDWVAHVEAGYEGALVATAKSWFTGYNANVPGHDTLRHMIYLGGAPAYRERLAASAAAGYPEFELR